jgi:cytochrome b561
VIALFSPFVVKTPKWEKSHEAQMQSWLLVVLHLLLIIGLLLIIIVGRNTSRANVESSQLGRSQ